MAYGEGNSYYANSGFCSVGIALDTRFRESSSDIKRGY